MHIILADSHPQALWALKIMLQEKPEIEVIGEVIDAESLLALALIHPPDLILIDMGLPGRSIEDLITDLHSCQSRPIVVVMSTKPENGRMMLNAGADAFISKGDQPEWLLETLQKYEKRFRKKENSLSSSA